MTNQDEIIDLIKAGKVEGFTSAPRLVETVLSRVFIFDAENVVLKIYKRDNAWWNQNMRDMSGGSSRRDFIRQDFEFNCHLNPQTYLNLKTSIVENGVVRLVDPKETDDGLVIVMCKVQMDGRLTKVLFEGKLALEDFENIGKAFALAKQSIPKTFLPETASNWYEHMANRIGDFVEWVQSEKNFPVDLAAKGLQTLGDLLEEHKEKFSSMKKEHLFVSIDCNPENLLYANGQLKFMDISPPKDEWRIGTFELDFCRVANDIGALAGKEACETFLKGVYSVTDSPLDDRRLKFYLLYGAMISGPAMFMMARIDQSYRPVAEKYLPYIESLLR